jgi:hypothetical protein
MADKLTREDVEALVGPADDLVLAAILGSGASAGELAEAVAWVENDEAMLNEGRPIPTGRVGQLVEIPKTKDEEESLAEPEP